MTPNPHRGSDFAEFLTEQWLMPTPRTDAIAHRGLGSVAYIAEVTGLARQLERELADERALADEMAAQLDHAQYTHDPGGCQKAFNAWKDQRR